MSDHAWQAILAGLSNPLLNGLTGWEILNLEMDDPAAWVQLSHGERAVIRHAVTIADDERARELLREWET